MSENTLNNRNLRMLFSLNLIKKLPKAVNIFFAGISFTGKKLMKTVNI